MSLENLKALPNVFETSTCHLVIVRHGDPVLPVGDEVQILLAYWQTSLLGPYQIRKQNMWPLLWSFYSSHHEHRTAMLSWRSTLKMCVCVYTCVCVSVSSGRSLVSGTRWILAEVIFSKMSMVYCWQSTSCHINTQLWWMHTVLHMSSCTSIIEWQISFVFQLTGKLGPFGPRLYLRKIHHARKFAKTFTLIFAWSTGKNVHVWKHVS